MGNTVEMAGGVTFITKASGVGFTKIWRANKSQGC